MTAWIKEMVDHADHPKIAGLTDAAYRWLHRSWTYAGKYETDGVLPPAWVRLVPPRVRRELDASKLWHENGIPGGREIHDWLEIQPSKAQLQAERAKNASRAALHRDPDVKARVRERDGDQCRYCGETVNWKARRGSLAGTYDHIKPTGENTPDNLVVACCGCNSRKLNRTPEEAGMRLLPPPF